MKSNARFVLVAGILALSLANLCAAQSDTDPGGEKDRKADRKAIQKSSMDFTSAFERGDARAAAAMWTADGEYHDDGGSVVKGRQALEKAYAEFFAKQPKRKLTLEIKGISFPSRDTAIEEGTLLVESGDKGLPKASRYNVLHVREDGVWRIAAVREWGGNQDTLEDLAWLVGDWSARSDDKEVHISFKWNASKSILRNEFVVRDKGQLVSSGLQIIGHDPRTGRLHSWMFPDDGGLAEADWSSEENRWLLESSGVTPDGIATSATNMITRINDNEFAWRSVNRMMGNDPAPDTPVVTAKRITTGKAQAGRSLLN